MSDEKIPVHLTSKEIRMLIEAASYTHLRVHGSDDSALRDLMYRLADRSSDVYTE